MSRVIFVVSFLLAAIPSSSPARLMPFWSYEDLFAQSDFVVIATPSSPTHDTPERITLPNLAPPTPVIGVATEFKALLVLKGKTQAQFVFHHYRLPESDVALVNGPTLVTFGQKDHGSYLLFLVREADGRFAPVAGQTDPETVSVQRLSDLHSVSSNQAMQPTARRRTASLSMTDKLSFQASLAPTSGG